MIKRPRYDVYVGGHMHVATLTSKKLKKLFKKTHVNVIMKNLDGTINNWRVETAELLVVPEGESTGI